MNILCTDWIAIPKEAIIHTFIDITKFYVNILSVSDLPISKRVCIWFVTHVLVHHPDSHTGLEIALLCADLREPLDNLELATLAESPIIKLDSLDERESWTALDTGFFALLGRLLEAVFEYCFCLICSLNNESLDKLFVGLTDWSLSRIFWEKKQKT